MAIAATTHVHAGGLAGFVQKHRSIDVYPTGAYRWGLLLLALAASTVATFELNYSSLLPLWMKSLHFTPREFGHYLLIAVVLATISTMLGGGLADRYGRVVVIDLCLTGVIVLLFCNLLMKGFWSFVLVRGGMTVLGGMSYPAVQGLTRDMSPRVGRGAAFGLVLFGAGLSAWVWTFVPGFTLAYFPSWQGQTVIMGIIAALLYLAVLLGSGISAPAFG
jgi:MFS family permease